MSSAVAPRRSARIAAAAVTRAAAAEAAEAAKAQAFKDAIARHEEVFRKQEAERKAWVAEKERTDPVWIAQRVKRETWAAVLAGFHANRKSSAPEHVKLRVWIHQVKAMREMVVKAKTVDDYIEFQMRANEVIRDMDAHSWFDGAASEWLDNAVSTATDIEFYMKGIRSDPCVNKNTVLRWIDYTLDSFKPKA